MFLRLLGLVYLAAFVSLVWQLRPLLGRDGLMPVDLFLRRVAQAAPGWHKYWDVPSLFWLGSFDGVMLAAAWLGVALSAALLLGAANVPILAALWLVYASFVHVGQLFYGYGWEMMMIEAGFLAIFLVPLWDPRPFPKDYPAPKAVMWLYRWMLFRTMFGAGMIKMRGDSCWRDLTCLYYHFETQPIPNPLSPYFARLPHAALKGGVLFNHFTELVAPWLLALPRAFAAAGGAAIALFQAVLILSGNLSWLNWLTIALCVPAFDDAVLRRLLPRALAARLPSGPEPPMGRARRTVLGALVLLVAVLSVHPAMNLLSTRQEMNASFDPIGLVNTYGAFGSVSRERAQVVLEGTDDPLPGEGAAWSEYQFLCQPGDVRRRPCVISPLQPRIDWQVWFAAMEDYRQNPWLVYFIYKLLRGDADALSLMGPNPFPGKPPRFIRAVLYRYRFADASDKSGAWWSRQRLGLYLPPLSLDDPQVERFVQEYAGR